jgi:Lysine methyltransferase
MIYHGNCGSSGVDSTQPSQQRGNHGLRDLFRTSSDSESSDDDCDDAPGLDDAAGVLFVGPPETLDSPQVLATPEKDNSLPSESSTTVVRTMQHVQLEVCTVGGSIEHRLWPAAEYLVSFILQQSNSEFFHDSVSSRRQWNSKNAAKFSDIFRDVRALLQRFVSRQLSEKLKVIELGAGVGYTSLKLAHHVRTESIDCKNNIQFLLTDLQSAMPLLERNVRRNFGERNPRSNDDNSNFPIQVQKLEWGSMEDIQKAICWYQNSSLNEASSTDTPTADPLLILGSDCVYWESLYGILETTIATLLQNAAPYSICLLANVRRWKRDTHFFHNILGQASATSKGKLHCICLHELVSRSNGNDNCDDTDALNEVDQRQVLRIYAVQWVLR